MSKRGQNQSLNCVQYSKKLRVATLVVATLIFVPTLLVVIYGFNNGAGQGQLGGGYAGIVYFQPFTIDSNILAALCALIALITVAKHLNEDDWYVPRWLARLMLACTCGISITFLVVALYLAPTGGGGTGLDGIAFYTHDMFFMHLLTPLLTIILFVFLLRGYRFGVLECFIGLIPSVTYGIVYCTCYSIGIWTDFYNFTLDGTPGALPIVCVISVAFTFLVSFVLTRAHNRMLRPKKAK